MLTDILQAILFGAIAEAIRAGRVPGWSVFQVEPMPSAGEFLFPWDGSIPEA